MIMECKRNADCIILPVFYDVDPSEVAVALLDHEKRFKEEMERVSAGCSEENCRFRRNGFRRWVSCISE